MESTGIDLDDIAVFDPNNTICGALVDVHPPRLFLAAVAVILVVLAVARWQRWWRTSRAVQVAGALLLLVAVGFHVHNAFDRLPVGSAKVDQANVALIRNTFGVTVTPSATGCLQNLDAGSETECATSRNVGGKTVEYRWTVVGDKVSMSLNGKMLRSR